MMPRWREKTQSKYRRGVRIAADADMVVSPVFQATGQLGDEVVGAVGAIGGVDRKQPLELARPGDVDEIAPDDRELAARMESGRDPRGNDRRGR